MILKETVYIKTDIQIPCAFGCQTNAFDKEEVTDFLFSKGYYAFDYSCFWNQELKMFCWECQIRPLNKQDLMPTYSELYGLIKCLVEEKRTQTFKNLDFEKRIKEKILVHFGASPENYV